MPWPLNVHAPGIAVHVIRRGRFRAACFFGERDRQVFLRCLLRYAVRFECAVHAYVLMGNHVHLLLTASDKDGMGRMLEALCEAHARYVNETGERTAALWEERFEVSPIHTRRHFLACMRYIELNPVRAQLVTRPEAFRWSSFCANALGREDELVTPHPFYYSLGRSMGERRCAYRRLFDDRRGGIRTG